MSLHETIETFRNGLMWIGLWALAAITAGCAFAFLRRAVRSAAAWVWRSRMWFERFAFIGLFSVSLLFGGGKTNSPPLLMMPFPPSLQQAAVPSVTQEEIAQGWRFVGETNCAAEVYTMPDGFSPTFTWHRRGTFGEWARLDLGGFAFPLGTNDEAVSSFSVFNDGRIRPTPRDAAREICAVGVPMLAMQGASRFWVADVAGTRDACPYQAKLLTWENFFLNADTNSPVNAQIELFQNGDFTTRSNDVERIYRRVAYFDWDGDGLENTVDPDPLVAGPDAHGTNAEWYNVICSNVLEAVAGDGDSSVELSWLDGVNSNAYYFVDVVATNGPAPIYFTGDRESSLGNPVVVARAFETNHVPLLIGIDYAVTSPVPFTVSHPDDYMYLELETNTTCRAHIRWPLNFVFTESIEESSRIYTLTVEPYDPGGVLTWDGGGMRSGASSGCGCGCLACAGYSVGFSCSAVCTCHGECRATGNYAFGGALFAVTGGVCRCGFDDPVETGTGSGTANAPSLSVSFSSQAVIFEDAYEDSPGVTKPRRSSRVRVTVDACAGAYGGSLSVSSANLGKLVPVGGGVELPIIDHALAADERFHVTGVYEGAEASTSANDVTLSSTFTEYFTSQQLHSDGRLTVVRVELRPKVVAPNNGSLNRHRYGVRELVQHVQEPLAPAVTWNPVGGGSDETVGLHDYYRCPLYGCENPLRAEIGATAYPFNVEVVEPEGMKSKATRALVYSNAVHRGESGGIGMELRMYVTPLDVSFSEIAVQEVPCSTYTVEGFFENPYFNGAFAHTGGPFGVGAGHWTDVKPDDNMLDGFDTAAYATKIPWLTPSGMPTTNSAYAWTEGHAYMDTPLGWNVKGTQGDIPPYKRFGEDLQQVFRIDQHGRVGVFKLDNWVIRTTNDVVTLRGPITAELP